MADMASRPYLLKENSMSFLCRNDLRLKTFLFMDYSMPSSWMEDWIICVLLLRDDAPLGELCLGEELSFRKYCPFGRLFLCNPLFIDEGLEGFPSIDASDTVGQNAHLFGSYNLQHILSAGLDAVVSSDSADIDAVCIA